MYTYDVISESVRNPHELAAELTRRSAQGWEIVQITYDGSSWFHAFVRHHGQVSPAPNAATMTAAPATGMPTLSAESSGDWSATPSANVPANWYKDPSSRYELRYWNGSSWTEHVSTAGKQSTDEPRS